MSCGRSRWKGNIPSGNSNSLCTVLINQSRGGGLGRGRSMRGGLDSGWHSIKAIKSFFSSTARVMTMRMMMTAAVAATTMTVTRPVMVV